MKDLKNTDPQAFQNYRKMLIMEKISSSSNISSEQVALANNYKYLANVNYAWRNQFSIWNLETGKQEQKVKLNSFNYLILFRFSTNSKQLFFAQYKDNSLQYVELETSNFVVRKFFLQPLLIHLSWSQDEKYICSISENFQHQFTVCSLASDNQNLALNEKFTLSSYFRTCKCYLCLNNRWIVIFSVDRYNNLIFQFFYQESQKRIKISKSLNSYSFFEFTQNLQVSFFKNLIIQVFFQYGSIKRIKIVNFNQQKLIRNIFYFYGHFFVSQIFGSKLRMEFFRSQTQELRNRNQISLLDIITMEESLEEIDINPVELNHKKLIESVF